MKSRTFGFACLVVVVAAIAAAYLWPHRSEQIPSSADRLVATRSSATPAAGPASPSPAATGGKTGGGIAGRDANRALFEQATNYWTYALAVLPAATAGDADAQYFLSKALSDCDRGNRMYFRREGRVLALDEGLRWASQRQLPLEVAQSIHEKCGGFLEGDASELGTAAAWLSRATAAGQPMAQAETAMKLLMQKNLVNSSGPAGEDTFSLGPRIVETLSPRELLRAAVESREPEVLFTVGNVQALLSFDNADESRERYAWWTVACERGFDCSPRAEWVQVGCMSLPRCVATGGQAEIVRSIAGDSWNDVQQRAREISAKLDAGQWDQLGLGQ